MDLSGQRRAGSQLGELRDGHCSPASSAVSRTKESGFPEKKSGWPDSPIVSGNEKQARCPLSWVGSGRASSSAACVGGLILTGKTSFLTGKNWHPASRVFRLLALRRRFIAIGPVGESFRAFGCLCTWTKSPRAWTFSESNEPRARSDSSPSTGVEIVSTPVEFVTVCAGAESGFQDSSSCFQDPSTAMPCRCSLLVAQKTKKGP